MMPEARIFRIEVLDPLIEGFLTWAGSISLNSRLAQ